MLYHPKCPAEGETSPRQCQPPIFWLETVENVAGAGKILGGTRGSPGGQLFTCGLALGVQGVDVHGEVEFVANDLLVLASKFVGTVDALGVPVCPVQAVFKHRDGKGVREPWGKSKRTSVQTWPTWPCPNLTLCPGSGGVRHAERWMGMESGGSASPWLMTALR